MAAERKGAIEFFEGIDKATIALGAVLLAFGIPFAGEMIIASGATLAISQGQLHKKSQ